MAERLLTPSKITAWLDCAHFLTLRHQVEAGLVEAPRPTFGSLAQLLADKGLAHEAACLAEYARQGKSILKVPDRNREARESFAAWVERVGNPFDQGWDVIFQMPFVHDGIRGIADFLIRVIDPDTGAVSYEPVDAKLARKEAKPGHVLQLCFYADAIEALSGIAPKHVHLWLGSGEIETLLTTDFGAYWRRLRGQLAAVLEDGPDQEAQTTPEPCDHCDYCEFLVRCTQQWRDTDSLGFVAGIRRHEGAALTAGAVSTLAALAALGEAEEGVEGVRPERLRRLVDQAVLQVEERESSPKHPPFRMLAETEDPTWGRGFELLPEPDAGDIFLDFEGHPFWRASVGLFFLFGWIESDGSGGWRYRTVWAHDLAEEADATRAVIEEFAARRADHPGMHVYHYNHTERSALESLAATHGVAERTLAELVDTGLFVDLLIVARNSLQAGVESYGLKYLERLTDYERGHDIDQGAGAVVEYEEYMASGEQVLLDRIAAYNEDDVRATMALRDWLVGHRPLSVEWREPWLEAEEPDVERDAQVEALHGFAPGSAEHVLGDLLGYWVREGRAFFAPKMAKFGQDTSDLLDDPEVIAGLVCVGPQVRLSEKTGKPITGAMRFEWPEQKIDGFKEGKTLSVMFEGSDGPPGYAGIADLDRTALVVDLVWNPKAEEAGVIPSAVVLNDSVSPKPKPESLQELASSVLGAGSGKAEANRASLALLRRDLPAFTAGHGPAGGTFTDDIDEMTEWVRHLDHSFVAIQGPPGTGKTYRGAHLIRSLVLAGQRVGITAMSHAAIENLMAAVVKVFEEAGDLEELRAVRKVTDMPSVELAGVTYIVGSNKPCARTEFNVVAGTSWLFSGNDLAGAPVDVLVVDEAGQMALADAVAASRSAGNVVLLGDPLQLAQVSLALHPGGAGASVLEHVLGADVTIPDDRGVFLPVTRRMHPDVCSFISEQIYEGRLTSHESCAVQATSAGTGLRWLRAHHASRSTESAEEAELVAAEIRRLMGTPWTNKDGVVSPLTTGDFMVVAPFNDQVNLLLLRLDADDRTRGVRVGTVDKFQGGEAPVVFFTMTTSSGDDMTRGADFLFSRNRLNVAISRARCLAYLVCTEELLNTRARTVEEMRLISTLAAFVEHLGA